MSKKTKSQKSEDFDPTDLEAISASGDPASQFIVKIDFDYCGVSYVGYQILSRNEIGMLLVGLRSGAQVGTLNMPGDWYEDFDVSELDSAFSIHSADPGDVAAMLSLLGHWVGQTSYFDSVLEAAESASNSDQITLEVAKQFLEDDESTDLSEMTSITDEAAEALSKHQGDLYLNSLTELSDAAAEALSKHQGELSLSGLTELSDAAAEALSKHQGNISCNSPADWTASLTIEKED